MSNLKETLAKTPSKWKIIIHEPNIHFSILAKNDNETMTTISDIFLACNNANEAHIMFDRNGRRNTLEYQKEKKSRNHVRKCSRLQLHIFLLGIIIISMCVLQRFQSNGNCLAVGNMPLNLDRESRFTGSWISQVKSKTIFM